MEIVVAVWVFFGALILESTTTGNGNEKLEPTVVLSEMASIPGPHPVKPITHSSDLTLCHFDKSVVYRDLTIPFRNQIDRSGTGVSDCEVNGNCSYHSTAFPLSTEIKHPHE